MRQPAMKPLKDMIEACAMALRHYGFTSAYHQVFELVRADSSALKQKAGRLSRETFGRGPADAENDGYEERSVRFLLLRKPGGELAGTLRVILPGERPLGQNLPLQSYCAHALLQAPDICEIAEFCMDARYRRREGDGRFLPGYHEQDIVEVEEGGRRVTVRRRIPYPQAALLAGAFEAALAARVLDCAWAAPPEHLPSLERIGIPCRLLGGEIPLHGGLQPLVFNIKLALDSMRLKAPHCWDIVSDCGRLQEIADLLHQDGGRSRLIDGASWREICEWLAL